MIRNGKKWISASKVAIHPRSHEFIPVKLQKLRQWIFEGWYQSDWIGDVSRGRQGRLVNDSFLHIVSLNVNTIQIRDLHLTHPRLVLSSVGSTVRRKVSWGRFCLSSLLLVVQLLPDIGIRRSLAYITSADWVPRTTFRLSWYRATDTPER